MTCLDFQENGSRTLSTDVQFPVTGMANTRTPTDGELPNCRHIVLTSAHPCNPHNVRFPEPVRSVEEEIAHRHAVVSATRIKYATCNLEDEVREIQRRLIDSVKVTVIKPSASISAVVLNDIPSPRTFLSKERHTNITAAELSERWLIGLSQATYTLKKTTNGSFDQQCYHSVGATKLTEFMTCLDSRRMVHGHYPRTYSFPLREWPTQGRPLMENCKTAVILF